MSLDQQQLIGLLPASCGRLSASTGYREGGAAFAIKQTKLKRNCMPLDREGNPSRKPFVRHRIYFSGFMAWICRI